MLRDPLAIIQGIVLSQSFEATYSFIPPFLLALSSVLSSDKDPTLPTHHIQLENTYFFLFFLLRKSRASFGRTSRDIRGQSHRFARATSNLLSHQPIAMASRAIAGVKRALAPPSPSPSNASNTSYNGTPSKKHKREDRTRDNVTPTPTPAALAASIVSFGHDDRTQKLYAVEFLKQKAVTKTLQEILDHLTLQHAQETYHKDFAKSLREHGQVTFLPDPASRVRDLKEKGVPTWRTGRYEFRAKIPGVKNKTTLLDYLQRKTDASKLEVKDLKDGWPDCDKAIDELEASHKILVVRTRKDGRATHIWLDQPSLFHAVDPEFRLSWRKVKLPDVDDMVRRLTAIGQKPASEDPNLNKIATEKKQKRRINRTSKKQTNEHMKHILHDYSHMVRK